MKALIISLITIMATLALGWLFLKRLSINHNESALDMHPSFFEKPTVEMAHQIRENETDKNKIVDFRDFT